LVARLEGLEFRAFQFQGYEGKRRVVSLGLRYNFNDGALHPAEVLPSFLLDLRAKAARLAGIPASSAQPGRQTLRPDHWRRRQPGPGQREPHARALQRSPPAR